MVRAGHLFFCEFALTAKDLESTHEIIGADFPAATSVQLLNQLMLRIWGAEQQVILP